ncbi:MAG: response regulator [Alphaproteobacteria bacterium]|nr:response regulator [Alphaproteobacteria bacterium]
MDTIDDLMSDRAALERLVDEHRLLKETIEHSPAKYCVYDKDDKLILWNKAYEEAHPEAFRKRAEQAEPQPLSYADIVHDELVGEVPADELEATVQRRLLRQRQANGEAIDHNNSSVGWLRITKFRVPSGAVAGMAIDINELKAMEATLAEAQKQAQADRQRLQDAIDNLDDGFVLYDEADQLVTFNEAYKAQLGPMGNVLIEGSSYEEQALKFAQSGMIPNLEGKEIEFVRDLMEKRHSDLGLEKTFQAHDGRWIRQRDKKTPSGNIVGLRTNITEHKNREAELSEARETALLADRAKSEFLANMSHEIRTPMNGVMGMAELLLNSDLAPKQQMFADMIVKSGASLLTIINDILDFSKIDAGQLELTPAPFQLAEAVEDVATLVSARAAEKNLELIVRVDPSLPESYVGDAGRIRQIITNLMGNAIKFSEEGHVYVDVSGTLDDNGHADLMFRVEDTGVGIPEEDCATVFKQFSQIDSSATRKHEGTGLGLSIASSLVKLMDGNIGVESEVGLGSTFWFSITLPIEETAKRKPRAPVDVTGARVLIIDDNEVNRSILAEQMDAWKFEHAEVSCGQTGLAVMRSAAQHSLQIDLVILDYQMPGMSGTQVLHEMRADPLISGIPVILLTSVDAAAARSAIGDLKLEANLTKPTRSSMMLDTMVEVLSEARAANEMTEPASLMELAQSMDEAWPSPTQAAPATEISEKLSRSEPVDLAVSATSGPEKVGVSDHPDALDVLVAEDNEVNQMVFTQILETTGYTFKIVENGRLAVASWKVHKPAIILMDVSMPEMNGHEATKAIREAEAGTGERVRIIGVTAHALNGDRETCFDAGMDDYLPKPVSVDGLKQALERHLKTQGDRDQNAVSA